MTSDAIVYGRSDDLVYVEYGNPSSGDHTEEFGGDRLYLQFSTGWVLLVGYGEGGTWQITVVKRGRRGTKCVVRPPFANDYSARATLSGEYVQWVEAWKAWPPEPDELRERLMDRLDADVSGLTDEQVKKILVILGVHLP